MKLLSCHIDNFGKFSNEDFEFSRGLNILLRENGWGKSTLAAFLRVMFYGFEGEGKREEAVNERKRFKPWGGGMPYGGSLCFENGSGEGYIIYRSFGTKAAEDVFELRKLDTNDVSDRYSANIGEELFDIDSASFASTVFISQQSCESAANSMITAKIGGVEHDESDLARFEAAVAKLQKEENLRTPNRISGSAKRLLNEITELSGRITLASNTDDEIAQDEATLSRLRESDRQLMTEREALLAQSAVISKQKDAAGLRAKYDALRENVLSCGKAAEASRAELPASIPAREELDGALLSIKKSAELRTRAEDFELSPGELEQLGGLEQMFAERLPEDGEAALNRTRWNEYTKELSDIEKKRVALEAGAAGTASGKGGGGTAFFIAGIVCIVLGVVSALAAFVTAIAPPEAGAAVAIIGMVLILLSILRKRSAAKREYEINSRALREEELSARETELIAKSKEVTDFLAEFKCSRDDDVTGALYALEDSVRRLQQLSDKRDRYEEALAEAARLREKVEGYMLGIGSFPGEDMEGQLQRIREKMSLYESDIRTLEAARGELERFEKTTDLSPLTAKAEPGIDISLEEISARIGDIDVILRDNLEQKNAVLSHLQTAQEKLERRQADEDMLLCRQEELAAARREYNLLCKAESLLTEAKESFTAEYLGPIRESFGKYYALMTQSNEAPFRLDSKLNLTVQEEGLQRNVALLSAGQRDLMGLCYRMALSDAMYPYDKPFILLDDPFTNLDANRIAGGMEFIEALKAKYQILYFTCYDGRA